MNDKTSAERDKAHANYFKERSNGHANHGGVLSNVFNDGFDHGAGCWQTFACAAGWAPPGEVQRHAHADTIDTAERYTLDEIATATRYADLSAYQYYRIRDELRRNRAIAATAGATHE